MKEELERESSPRERENLQSLLPDLHLMQLQHHRQRFVGPPDNRPLPEITGVVLRGHKGPEFMGPLTEREARVLDIYHNVQELIKVRAANPTGFYRGFKPRDVSIDGEFYLNIGKIDKEKYLVVKRGKNRPSAPGPDNFTFAPLPKTFE